MPSDFLKSLLKNSKHITIRKSKSKKGISKKEFVSKLQGSEEFQRDLKQIQSKHGVQSVDQVNEAFVSDLASSMSKYNDKHVTIRKGTSASKFSTMAKPPSTLPHTKPTTLPVEEISFTDSPSKKLPQWARQTIMYGFGLADKPGQTSEALRPINDDLLRSTRSYYAQWKRDNPEIEAAGVGSGVDPATQKELVKVIEKLLEGLEQGAGKGGAEVGALGAGELGVPLLVPPSVDLPGAKTREQTAIEDFIKSKMGTQMLNRAIDVGDIRVAPARIPDPIKLPQPGASSSSSSSSSSSGNRRPVSREMEQGITADMLPRFGITDPQHQQAIVAAYTLNLGNIYQDLLDRGLPQNTALANAMAISMRDTLQHLDEYADRRKGTPTDTDIQNLHDQIQSRGTGTFTGTPDMGLFTRSETPDELKSIRPKTAVVGGSGFPGPGPGATEDFIPPRSRTATRTPDDPPNPPDQSGQEFDPHGKKDDKRTKPKEPWKPIPLPPRIPEPPTDDRRPPRPPRPPTDTDDDDDKKKREKEKRQAKEEKVKPWLRPYFLVGGQDILRLTESEKVEEITDWNLFNFVPGESNQQSDNPLTALEQKQYAFRYANTHPLIDDPQILKYTGYNPNRVPTKVMRDVYERDQIFYDPYNKNLYRGRDLFFDQNRHNQSDILDIHKQRHEHPDIYQSNQLNARTQAKFKVPSSTVINMSSKF